MVFSSDAFAGRVYGVTGGSRGIGAAVVGALLDTGASVLVMARDSWTLERLAEHIDEQQRGRLRTVAADVSDESAMTQAIADTVARFGRLDGWVNNAMSNPGEPLASHSEARFRKAWEVNLLAAWRAARLCLPHFQRAGGGAIVNISSVMSQQTSAGQTAYTSCKAGLEGLTRALAVELAEHRVRVNAVLPGHVVTQSHLFERNPDQTTWSAAQRLDARVTEMVAVHSPPWPDGGRPRDIAGPVLFLLSDAARFITGTSLVVDGGLMAALRDISDAPRAAMAQQICELKKQREEQEAKEHE